MTSYINLSVRVATALAGGVAVIGALFAATPAFAYYGAVPVYGDASQVCSSRFDPNCIVKETAYLNATAAPYSYNYGSYGNNYSNNYRYTPSYNYTPTPIVYNTPTYNYAPTNYSNSYYNNYNYNTPAYTPSYSYNNSYSNSYDYQYGYDYNYSYQNSPYSYSYSY